MLLGQGVGKPQREPSAQCSGNLRQQEVRDPSAWGATRWDAPAPKPGAEAVCQASRLRSPEQPDGPGPSGVDGPAAGTGGGVRGGAIIAAEFVDVGDGSRSKPRY